MRGTRDGCILTLRKSRPLLFNSLCRNPPGTIIRLQKGGPVWSCILTAGRCWGAWMLRRWCSSSPSDGPFNVLHQSRCSFPAQVKAITAQEVAFNPAVHCKLGMPNEVKLSLLSGHRTQLSVDMLSPLVQHVQMSNVVCCTREQVRCPWKYSGDEDLHCRVYEPNVCCQVLKQKYTYQLSEQNSFCKIINNGSYSDMLSPRPSIFLILRTIEKISNTQHIIQKINAISFQHQMQREGDMWEHLRKVNPKVFDTF